MAKHTKPAKPVIHNLVAKNMSKTCRAATMTPKKGMGSYKRTNKFPERGIVLIGCVL